MSSPPIDRTEFWIRFVCGFLFFGIVCALLGLRLVDSMGMVPTISICVVTTLAISIYVARIGDEGWRNLLNFFRWW